MKILRESCKQYADFNVVLENMFDSGSALKRVNGKSRRQCLLACISYSPCKSVNYKNDGGLCDLLDRNLTSNAGVLQQKAEWTYITTDEYSLKVRILSSFFIRENIFVQGLIWLATHQHFAFQLCLISIDFKL